MSDILNMVITGLITFLTTGGIAGILYAKQDKKLKDLEVKASEADVKSDEIANLAASNEEWIKLYHECEEKLSKVQSRCDELTDRLEEVHNTKKELWEKFSNCQKDCATKDLVISELNWYRCEVNGCPYRKPPRRYGEQDFPKDALNPIENPDESCL